MKTHRLLAISIFALAGISAFGQATEEEPRVITDDAPSPRITEGPGKYLHDPMPERWLYKSPYTQKLPQEDDWWHTFGDRDLDSLISMAMKENYNLQAAMQRIEMASRALDVARAAYYPNLGISAGYTKGQSSGASGASVVKSSPYSYFSLGATMQWEIDIFGKIRQNVKAQKASYNASRAEYDGAMIALAANVAKAYINLRMYQSELSVARQHLEGQQKVLAIVEARFKAGLADMLDVAQSKTVVASTQASIPSLEAQIDASINSLALLTGHYPYEVYEWLSKDTGMPEVVYGAQMGVPNDLLRRRPDIIEAEENLAQCAAQVGIAKSDFLPTLSLGGSIGTQSHDAKHLFGSHSMYWEVAPTLSWTVFDGMARNAKTAEARAQMEASIDTYNYTVMNAVVEVGNATTTFKSSMETVSLEREVIDQSRKALDLSLDLYKRGLSPFSNVVDAQITNLENQNAMLTAKGNALTSVVALYEALGGGW